ncbi:MAG: hypothetical protein Kow0079_13900 [Vicingaceae bacterium]
MQGYIEVGADSAYYLLESEGVLNTFGGTVYLRMKKYDGTNWNQMGQDLVRNVENNESHIDFLLTPSNEFYIGMKDSILKYNTTTNVWQSFYVPEFYGGLGADDSGNVYFIHRVQGASGAAYSDLSIAKFDNGTVTIEGSLAVDIMMIPRRVNASNKIIYKNNLFYISIVSQSTNLLYVFKGNSLNGFQKLEQGAPNNSSTFFTGFGLSSMAVSNSGNIFVSYRKPSGNNEILIAQYDSINDAWIPFDTTGIHSTFASHNQLRFDKNDTLHLIYHGPNDKGFLFKYDGQEWKHIGPKSFWSYNTINYLVRPHLTFDMNNDILFSKGFGNSSFPFQVFKYQPGSVGFQDFDLEDKINIYPNPSKDLLYVEHIPLNATINIYDLTGRAVFSQKYFENNLISIDISTLTEGTYFLQIEHNGNVSNKKIIVSK